MSVAREYPASPLVGVGAVVLQGDSILLVRRGREPMKGEWSLPGGRLELGETLEQGVVREVLEETGLVVTPLAHIETISRIVHDEDGRVRYHYVLIDFLCEVTGGSLASGDDAMEAAWVSVAELGSPSIAVADFTQAVIQKALLLR